LAPPAAVGRRRFLVGAAAAVLAGGPARAQTQRFRIAFANQTEDLAVRLDGLGFTGFDVRRSFEFAARTLPVDMVYYDNAGDGDKALANADDAIATKVDLFIEYSADTDANIAIGQKLHEAGIRTIAINYAVPGAPLYTADNLAAGTIAGSALGDFARQNWPDQSVVAVIAGDLGDVRPAMADRVQGVLEGLRQHLPNVAVTKLDTSGNAARVAAPLGKFLRSQSGKVLVATLDDPTAVAVKTAIELGQRLGDCIIVSHGVDRSIHGGASDKKELDPNNRSSIVLGSVAFFLDRYGYDVLPLAMRLLNGEQIPLRTATKHVLVTARNVFQLYPPFDMN